MSAAARTSSWKWRLVGIAVLCGAAFLGYHFASDGRRDRARLEAVLPDPSRFDALLREALERAVARVRSETESGEAWGQLAMLCQAHGLHAEARDAYLAAADRSPRDARWPHLLGITCEILSLREEAELAHARALDLEPRDLVALCSLARLLQERGENDRARRLYLRAIEVGPRSVAARVGLGQLAARAGAWDMAEKNLELALEADRRCGRAHAELARIHSRRGNAGDAAFHGRWSRATSGRLPLPDPLMDRVLELGVSYSAFLKRGELRGRRSEWELAAEEFRGAARVRGDLAQPRYYLGVALERQGMEEEAIAELRAATRLAGEATRLNARLRLARLLADQERWDEAHRAIEEALEVDRDNARALVARGKLHFRQRRDDLALADFERAISIHPDCAEAFLEKGALLMLETGAERADERDRDPEELRCRRLEEALAALERALELQVDRAGIYELAGGAHMALRECSQDPEESERLLAAAIDRFSKLVRCFPEQRSAYLKLARALAAAGDERQALEVLKRARRRWPGDARFRSPGSPIK